MSTGRWQLPLLLLLMAVTDAFAAHDALCRLGAVSVLAWATVHGCPGHAVS